MGRLIPAGTGMEYYRNVGLPSRSFPRSLLRLRPTSRLTSCHQFESRSPENQKGRYGSEN